jgi:hypothetical protein
LPPYVTQLWLPFSGHSNGFKYDNLGNVSHLSLRGELSPSTLEQFRNSPVHYLAHDVAPWIASKLMLPDWFQRVIPNTFSGLRILRLIGYWVTCETGDNTIPLHQPPLLGVLPESPEWVPPDPFHLGGQNNPPVPVEDESTPLGIGSYLAVEQGDLDKSKVPKLHVEPGFVDMLRCLPQLKALEVGGFVVRDAAQIRTQAGHAKHWLSQRSQWEEDFINCIILHSAKSLVAVSFLACDKSLYLSTFPNTTLPSGLAHRLWTDYLCRARIQSARDIEESGTTIPNLMAQAGIQPWTGSASEPTQCNYNVDSAFVPSKLARNLSEEVVVNEWVNKGSIDGWKKRVNVRHLRDVWPQGC